MSLLLSQRLLQLELMGTERISALSVCRREIPVNIDDEIGIGSGQNADCTAIPGPNESRHWL